MPIVRICFGQVAGTMSRLRQLELLRGRKSASGLGKGPRRVCDQALETEREFNRRAGVSEEFYDLPEFMREEPLPPKNSVFDIPMQELQRIWDVKIPKDVF